MEINQTDRGVFKGMGKLQSGKHANRKYFPNLRNIHQFQYTHNHHNDYKTSFQSFRPFDKHQYKYHKANKNSNQSHFALGNDLAPKFESEAKNHFRKHNYSMPPKPIKHADQGIGINQYEQRTGEKIVYCSTTNDNFNPFKKLAENQNVKYKYNRTDRFNPITGEFKANTTFGFQDFVPQNNRNYKANNFTVMPRREQKYDIISGRRLTYL